VQFDNVGVVLNERRRGERGRKFDTYEDFEDVDLIDEGGVVLDLFLLNCLDGKLLVAFSVLSQVHDAETTVG
jgi:hypothetical protein